MYLTLRKLNRDNRVTTRKNKQMKKQKEMKN